MLWLLTSINIPVPKHRISISLPLRFGNTMAGSAFAAGCVGCVSLRVHSDYVTIQAAICIWASVQAHMAKRNSRPGV